MYPTLSDALVLASTLKNSLQELGNIEIVLAPPIPWIVPILESWRSRREHIHFAAQNVWPEDQGAYTGEVSAFLLKNVTSYAIVGHSERRRSGEDNELVNSKVHACLRWRLKPILCIGESKRLIDKDGRVDSYQWSKLAEQLTEGLSGVKAEDLSRIAIAYEPVWAISANAKSTVATPEYTVAVIQKIKAKLREKYSANAIDQLRFLYGGSVDSGNVATFLKYHEVEGFLVGSASVKAREFIQICKLAAGV